MTAGIKGVLRHVMNRLAPRRAARRRFQWRLKLHGRAAAAIARGTGLTVQTGPFAGMKYPRGALEFAERLNCAPKLLGSYEAELEEVVVGLDARGYREVINVGAAEGYYAVGLALRMPDARVYAFESDETVRALCREAAAANGVAEQISISGKCDANALRSLPLAGALVVCDCEGFEGELLQPDVVPGLWECDILVELHDWFVDGVTEAVLTRFRTTHEVVRLQVSDRDPDAYPALMELDPDLRSAAVSEFKPRRGIEWAWMTRLGT